MPPVIRSLAITRVELEALFPNLANASWAIKSPYNDSYQCIAWAAGDTTRKWWPVENSTEAYWPPATSKEESIDCFASAFATMGYRRCESADFELGFQKVAIYADEDMTPTHMARQHFLGRGWLSKLGDLEDILHRELRDIELHRELRDIEGDAAPTLPGYGRAVLILKRSWWTAIRCGLFKCWLAAFRFWIERLLRSHAVWV